MNDLYRKNADPYGVNIPTRIQMVRDSSGEVVMEYSEPPVIPPYLRPIPFNTRDIHAELRKYLNAEEPKIARWLYSTWNAEREAIKYQEIRNAIRDGEIPISWIDQWQQDYSRFVVEVLEPSWLAAMSAAAKVVQKNAGDVGFDLPEFNPVAERVTNWVQSRGAELTVNLSLEQQNALRVLILRFGVERQIGPEELARYLRPVIGLTQRQVEAVIRFRDALLEEGMEPEKVIHKTANYAGFLHRHRAQRIARTELAYAYNFGQFEEVRQSVDAGVLPRDRTVKVWSTADDERTCSFCRPLDGAVIGLEETFPGATKRLPNIFVPPAHPHCRCAVEYRVLEDVSTRKGRTIAKISARMDALLSQMVTW